MPFRRPAKRSKVPLRTRRLPPNKFSAQQVRRSPRVDRVFLMQLGKVTAMKKVLSLVLVLTLGLTTVGCGDKKPATPPPPAGGAGTPPPATTPDKPATP